MICSEILCIVSLVKRIIKDFIVKHVLVIIALVSANNLLNIMIKLANKIALQSFVKNAAEDGGDKPYSSAEPSFVDRLVMGPLANNVAREAETDGGAGLKAYLYPTLAGAGGSILGNVAGSELADVLDMSPRAQRNLGTAGSIAGGLAGLLGTIALRNKAKSEDTADYTTSDITPGAVGQRMVGGAIGGLGGMLGGGLAGAGAGAGLAALAALATGNNANQFARVGGVAGGALGAGISGLLGKAKGEEIADTLRQAREAKSMNKKASLANLIDEYRDNQSAVPETLSALAGVGTAGAAGATGYTALAKRLMSNPEFAKAMKTVKDQYVDAFEQNSAKHLNKGRSVFGAALRAFNNTDNTAQRFVRNSLANDNSKAARLYKFLSKNRKWGIPATLAGGALGALGIHNMID